MQFLSDFLPLPPDFTDSGEQVEAVTTFTCIGALITISCGSHSETFRGLGMARAAMRYHDRIWRSGVALQHLRQTQCSICPRDLDCHPAWQWQDWRVQPVVFEAHLWSPLVRSYNQCGDYAPHLSTTIKQDNHKALPDFNWSCGSNGASPRHFVCSSFSGATIMVAAKGEAPFHMDIN